MRLGHSRACVITRSYKKGVFFFQILYSSLMTRSSTVSSSTAGREGDEPGARPELYQGGGGVGEGGSRSAFRGGRRGDNCNRPHPPTTIPSEVPWRGTPGGPQSPPYSPSGIRVLAPLERGKRVPPTFLARHFGGGGGVRAQARRGAGSNDERRRRERSRENGRADGQEGRR